MPRAYLISYDIADPRRLVRLHRTLKRYALPIQYSVFYAELTDAGLAQAQADIVGLINPKSDDVRIYPMPLQVWAYRLGRGPLPPGIDFTGVPSPFQPLYSDDAEPTPQSNHTNGGNAALWVARRTRVKMTKAQRHQARNIEARVQTGDRRGIALL